ncbi:SNF1-related protein [Drosera capensis]
MEPENMISLTPKTAPSHSDDSSSSSAAAANFSTKRGGAGGGDWLLFRTVLLRQHFDCNDSFAVCLSLYNSFRSTCTGKTEEGVTMVGFEVSNSPDSSYCNPHLGLEDEAREPPTVPPHLQHTLLSCPASSDAAGTLPLPQSSILNHLYIENRDASRPVVALGFTHRFRSKFVTVVLYKPVPRRGTSA